MQNQIIDTDCIAANDTVASIEDLSNYELSDLIKLLNLKSNSSHKSTHSINLKCNNTKKIALISILKDTSINSFQAGESIIFRVLEGTLNLSSCFKVKRLEENDVAILAENTKFNLTAVNDCIFVMTTIKSKPDSNEMGE